MTLGIIKKAETAGKRKLASLAGWIGKRQSVKIHPVSKILLVKQAERLGNIVLLGLAVRIVKAEFPKLQISILVPKKYRLIADMNPAIDQVIPLAKREFLWAPWKLYSLVNRLQNQDFDMAIDCSDNNSPSTTSRFYILMAKAKSAAGYDSPESPAYTVLVDTRAEVGHAVGMYLRLFEKIFRTQFIVDLEKLARRDINNSLPVLINLGGRGAKVWAVDKFIEVGRQLESLGIDVELLVGPDDRRYLDRIEKLVGQDKIFRPDTLPELIEKFQNISGFISSDTGPMHLAWSQGIPTVAIFVNSQLEKFRPLGEWSIALDSRLNPVLPEDVVRAILSVRGNGR